MRTRSTMISQNACAKNPQTGGQERGAGTKTPDETVVVTLWGLALMARKQTKEGWN